MNENLFDLNKQYIDLCITLGFDESKIQLRPENFMYMIFMSGASVMFDLMVMGVGNMPEKEAMETIELLKKQLEDILG